ncbi:MAG: hypothetical protein MJ237_03475 [bacterium]|nr:hypothetical protein [bacterium]
MAEFKNVMTTENLVDFLDQKPRVDKDNGNIYFSCPYCREEALEKLKNVLRKKDFENVANLDLEFGTLIFNPETHDIACSSRPNSHYDDEHAIEIEAEMVKWHLPSMDYGEYLDAKFNNIFITNKCQSQ